MAVWKFTFVSEPVLPLLFFSLDLGFFCFIWGFYW